MPKRPRANRTYKGRPKGAKDLKPRFSAKKAKAALEGLHILGIDKRRPDVQAAIDTIDRIEEIQMSRGNQVLRVAVENTGALRKMCTRLQREWEKAINEEEPDEDKIIKIEQRVANLRGLLNDMLLGVIPYYFAKYGPKAGKYDPREALPQPKPTPEDEAEAQAKAEAEAAQAEEDAMAAEGRSKLINLASRYKQGRKKPA